MTTGWAVKKPMKTHTQNRFAAAVIASSLVMLAVMPLAALADNPVPMLASILPSSVLVGSSNFNLAVYGNNFTTSSVVRFNGLNRATTFVSSTQLNATILSSDVAVTGASVVDVANPIPGGGVSNSTLLTIAPIAGTPVLPDTGFGPAVSQGLPASDIAVAGITLLGLLMVAFEARRAWLQR